MIQIFSLSFLPRFCGQRKSFKVGVIATLAITVAANISVLGNLGVIFGNTIPGAANQNLYEPYFRALKLKSAPTEAFGIFRPVYDNLATLLDGRADTALYQISGGILGEGPRKKLLDYLYVTPSLAKVLGVHVVAGRSIRPSDMASGAAPVIVVSAKLVHEWFISYDAALGHTLRISGKSYRIIGVLPPALQFPSQRFLGGYSPQAWIPLPPETPGVVNHMNRDMYAIVHPHLGLTVGTLKTAFANAYQQALPVYTVDMRTYMKDIQLVQRVSSLAERQYGPVLARLQLLELAALLLLVLVFINLAGLTTSDVISRRHELAARAALGASGWRLFWARFCLLIGLGFIGWLFGIGLGWLGQRALAGSIGQAGASAALSAPVLLITFGFVAIIAILLSTIGLRRVGKLRHLLADLTFSGTTGSRKMVRVMRLIIALQLAVSVVLLVLAGNFYTNVFGLTHNNLGFIPSHRDFFTMMLPGAKGKQKEIFDQNLLARLNQRVDIKGAAQLSVVPFSGNDSSTNAWVAGGEADQISINEQAVSKRFGQAMGLKILAGDPNDIFSDTSHKIFIDETAMEKLWPSAKPSDVVGRSLYLGWNSNYHGPYRVAAVVAPLRMKPYGSIGGTFFISYKLATNYGGPQSFIVHSSLPPGLLHKAVASSIHAVNPQAMLLSLHSVKSVIDEAYDGRAQLGRVFGVLAIVALLISAVGLFALLAYRSLVRRPEFAIRGALGATPVGLLGEVLGEAGIMWMIGCMFGVPAAYGISVALAAYFPQLGLPAAWATIATIVAMGIIVLIAALVPARRAAGAGTDLSGNLPV